MDRDFRAAVKAYVYGSGDTEEERKDDVDRRLFRPWRTYTWRRWVILTNRAIEHVASRRYTLRRWVILTIMALDHVALRRFQ